MAVLAQQAQRRVSGVAPLALEGDEDGSARELQQPAQALPARAALSERARLSLSFWYCWPSSVCLGLSLPLFSHGILLVCGYLFSSAYKDTS